MNIRNATPSDAPTVADMVDLACEGIPRYLWRTQARPGETVVEAGLRQTSASDGEFSFTHGRVYTHAGQVVGVCQAFDLDSVRDQNDIHTCCAVVRGLVELESMASGTWYINALATAAHVRRRGVARALLADSVRRADTLGLSQVSLIVSSNNQAAKAMYDSLGFQFEAQRVAEEFPEQGHGGEWILMLAQTSKLMDALPALVEPILPAADAPLLAAQPKRRAGVSRGALAVGV